MRLSHPITDGGSLIAVAALGEMSWFLLAIDARLEELDRANFPSVEAAEHAARGYLRRNHPVSKPWTPSEGKSADVS
ncbi:hypothetical protein [Roseococcus sp. YIM B11640]|uniref:hypothetical protein n=1 Tax=Roseococcus sp. YIM B11640 TaxID=3133973 RepID=UPI003C7E1BD4